VSVGWLNSLARVSHSMAMSFPAALKDQCSRSERATQVSELGAKWQTNWGHNTISG
jgi:hypothetical protein